jgi:DNA-binding ferritin-like protein
MAKTRKNRSSKRKSSIKKSRISTSLKSNSTFVAKLLELNNVVRLYHWNTRSYSAHKATDSLYENLNNHIDSYVETWLGKTDKKIHISNIKLINIGNNKALERYIQQSIQLVLREQGKLNRETDVGLLAILDEVVAELNKFIYLLRLT